MFVFFAESPKIWGRRLVFGNCMIKNLIFDFGKVLVDYNFSSLHHIKFSAEADRELFARTLNDPAFVDRCDREEVPFEELVAEMQREQPQLHDQWQQFYDLNLEFVTGEVPGMRAYIKELKARGYKVYGLSNWCSRVKVIMQQYAIFELLDGWVVSSELQIIKPEPGIYEALFLRYDLRPEECVFADDKRVNIEAAEKLGMRGIVFENMEQYKAALEPLLAVKE